MTRVRHSGRLDQAMDRQTVFCASREASSDSAAQRLTWLRHWTGTGNTTGGLLRSSLHSILTTYYCGSVGVCSTLDSLELNRLSSHRSDLRSPTIRSVQD